MLILSFSNVSLMYFKGSIQPSTVEFLFVYPAIHRLLQISEPVVQAEIPPRNGTGPANPQPGAARFRGDHLRHPADLPGCRLGDGTPGEHRNHRHAARPHDVGLQAGGFYRFIRPGAAADPLEKGGKGSEQAVFHPYQQGRAKAV